MAIRVRKLAKELNRSSVDLLGLLHAIGYVRYRSPEDMVADSAVERLRRAMREGVEPVPVDGVAAPRSTPSPGPRRQAREERDLMSMLVPGVVKHGGRKGARSGSWQAEQPVVEPEPVEPAATDPDPREEAEERAEVDRQRPGSERAQLESERAQLESERARLESEREQLEEARQQLEAEQRQLDEARRRLEAEQRRREDERPANEASTGLADVLAKRGLKGVDEAERALAALAGVRQLRDLIGLLCATDVEAVTRVLEQRLVLVGGDVPDLLPAGIAGVTVSPERGELPGGSVLHRELTRVGELLMLNGLRRVLVVGGRPSWQRVLREGVDSRVEVRFVPGKPRGRAEAEVDVTRTDAVVLWGVEADAEAHRVYGTSRALLVPVPASDLPSLLRAVRAVLDVD